MKALDVENMVELNSGSGWSWITKPWEVEPHSLEPVDVDGGWWCHENCLSNLGPHWWGQRPFDREIEITVVTAPEM